MGDLMQQKKAGKGFRKTGVAFLKTWVWEREELAKSQCLWERQSERDRKRSCLEEPWRADHRAWAPKALESRMYTNGFRFFALYPLKEIWKAMYPFHILVDVKVLLMDINLNSCKEYNSRQTVNIIVEIIHYSPCIQRNLNTIVIYTYSHPWKKNISSHSSFTVRNLCW